jgi:hypothetical protein
MALRKVKYCAIYLVAFIMGAEIYLFAAVRDRDDITGGVAIGLLMIFLFSIAATSAAVFERRLQNGR